MARYSIGIDLGTTNCAMAFVRLDGGRLASEVFSIRQLETLGGSSESATLPSFLYLPTEREAALLRGGAPERCEWIAGRFARKQAAEFSGRVAHSAKSWLCHHAVDRNAPFLPWRSDELPVDRRISPIQASALLLASLRSAWDARFGAADPDERFDAQSITVTVPASFDPAAQRLTLDAAKGAGFPDGARLLEEPQAAFYRWLEQNAGELGKHLPEGGAGAHHVVVIDIGGGTSDFSMFEVSDSGGGIPHIKRIAVSDHLLLGGDNIDLALAHRIEPRLAGEGRELSASQWGYLAAQCRDLKERCLSTEAAEGANFPISVPGRGSGLFGKTLTAHIERREVESIVLDGFFPDCAADATPERTQAGLREWALPYAPDSAITRYLADFLRGRPPVDAVLFNGGSLYPGRLRSRLLQQIGRWQGGSEPGLLENPEPDLAVARGAARFGALLHSRARRIEAGAARALYLEVQQRQDKERGKALPALVCILPRGAETEEEFNISTPGLGLRVNRPVQFQAYYSTRHGKDRAGALVTLNESEFHRLPPLQTVAKVESRRPGAGGERLPVKLAARMNELGLLQVSCVSTEPKVKQSWPLEFQTRESAADEAPGAARNEDLGARAGVDTARLESVRMRITELFSRPLNNRDKISATLLLKSLEKILGIPKAEWNWALIRTLWSALHESFSCRRNSIEHEEAWIILAGFLLRPGFGAPGDEDRIDQLWQLHSDGPAFPSKRIQLQEYVLWRRVAGGLSAERQVAILTPEMPRLAAGKSTPAELVRLAGALERIAPAAKSELIRRFLDLGREATENRQYSAPYFVALGLLLNRAPLHAGPEAVVGPGEVGQAFEALRDLDWSDSELAEIPTLFLRAARVIDDRNLDVPKALRDAIASKLEKSGVAQLKVERLRRFVPIERAERASLIGESLPPGLVLEEE